MTRKLLLVVPLFVTFVTVLAQGDDKWIEVSKANKSTLFVQVLKQVPGEPLLAWVRYSRGSDRPDLDRDYVAKPITADVADRYREVHLEEFDCEKGLYRINTATYYFVNGQYSSVDYAHTDDPKLKRYWNWERAAPDTLAAAAVKYVCEHRK